MLIALRIAKRGKIQFGQRADEHDVVICHCVCQLIRVGGSGKRYHLLRLLTERIKVFFIRENHFGKVIFFFHTDRCESVDPVVADDVTVPIKTIAEFTDLIDGTEDRVEVTQKE